MRFRAERSEFAEAVAWAQRTVGDRATFPAMSGIRLTVEGERLQLASTNVDMDSELQIPVQSEQDGSVLVPGKLLSEVVRALPNEAVSADAASDALHLSCGRASFTLRLLPVDDFPDLKQPSADGIVAQMKSEEFSRTVEQVVRSASTDDARAVLTGVSFEATPGRLVAAATDSYRLAVRTVPWEQDAEATALIPRRALEQARHAADLLHGDVQIVLEPGQASFVFGDRRLVTRLVEGRFPDFRQLIPSGFERRLLVDRLELRDVVKRVAVVGDVGSAITPVVFDLEADTLVVRSTSSEVGQAEESLHVEFEGEPLKIAFNPRLLTDGLEAAGGEHVAVELRDELKPAVLRPVPPEDGQPADADFLYLLMPMRL